MNILLILLGCNIFYLLSNRINTAVNFAGKFNETNVDLFLSWGITEAEKISKFEKIYTQESRGNRWNYIYDKEETNTVENFIMARNFINKNNDDYSEVYIITSDFIIIEQKKCGTNFTSWIQMDIRWRRTTRNQGIVKK